MLTLHNKHWRPHTKTSHKISVPQRNSVWRAKLGKVVYRPIYEMKFTMTNIYHTFPDKNVSRHHGLCCFFRYSIFLLLKEKITTNDYYNLLFGNTGNGDYFFLIIALQSLPKRAAIRFDLPARPRDHFFCWNLNAYYALTFSNNDYLSISVSSWSHWNFHKNNIVPFYGLCLVMFHIQGWLFFRFFL